MAKKKLYEDTIYCNLFGGPGTGKSTMMADVFSRLKWMGVDCEIATEYAKDKVWEGSLGVLECQVYVFGKQVFRNYRLKHKVKVVITDSPILLSPIYDKRKSPAFLNLVLEEFNRFNNVNVFLKRDKKYNPNGRLQTRDQAVQKDKEILDLLSFHNISFMTFEGKKQSASIIADILKRKAKDIKKLK
ncbi:MAG: AAA family ATPase [Candidatus Paceibacterota bacterium]|jgi:nicotinamide riboside kinase